MKLLLRWLASAIALLLVAYFVPGFHVSGFGGALIAALVIGLVNGTLGALLKLLTFPIRWLTLGLFSLVINAFMLLVADWLLDSLRIDGFLTAFLGSILLSLITFVLRSLIPDAKEDKDN